MSETFVSGIIVGLLAIMFWTPALMSMGISKMEGEISGGERVICCIPIVNIIRSEYKYFGRLRLVTFSTIFVILISVFRVGVWYKYYQNVTLGTVSIVLFWAALAFWIVSNMMFVYTVIHDADALRGAKLLFYTIAFPFGQYFIGAYLPNIIRHAQAKEDTFKR
jgi:carbon starvation protein CstA